MTVALLVAQPQLGLAVPGSPLHDGSMPCVHARVERIEDFARDGMRNRPIPYFGKLAIYSTDLGVEGIVIDGTSWNARVLDQRRGHTFPGRENIGDAVQVCLAFRPPAISRIPNGCKPGDPRGRIYRVYDYRLREVYEAGATTHLCGGA